MATMATETPEHMIRQAHTVYARRGVPVSHSKVVRIVRRYVRTGGDPQHFTEHVARLIDREG